MDEIYVTLQMTGNSPHNGAMETFKYNESNMRFEPFDTFANEIPNDAVQTRLHTSGNGEYHLVADPNNTDLQTIAGMTGNDIEGFKSMHLLDMEVQVGQIDNANKVHDAIYNRMDAEGIVPIDEIEETIDYGNGKSQTTFTPIYSPEDQAKVNGIAREEVGKFGYSKLPRNFMDEYTFSAPNAGPQNDLGVKQDTMNVLDSIKQQFDNTLDTLNQEMKQPVQQQPVEQAPAKSGGRGF